MPVTPTYPGLYLEELPSNARTVTAAPTSIAVFVGYTHPFKTVFPNEAVQVFSFAEYERLFGGLYASGAIQNDVAHAVNQFFLNGGSVAYVVGLVPQYRVPPVPPATLPTWQAVTGGTAAVGGALFTAREPTDTIGMSVTVSNASGTTADIVVSYGTQSETFRAVSLTAGTPSFIETVIGTSTTPRSTLVTVAPATGGYGASLPNGTVQLSTGAPATTEGTFSPDDFSDVFEADSSLDKVPIFNLLCLPGVVDRTVWAKALAFAERKLAFAIIDAPYQAAADATATPPLQPVADLFPQVPRSTNAAFYFPWLRTTDPLTGRAMDLAPSGVVAGKFADTDRKRGVWKAPAGLETSIASVSGVVAHGRLTDQRQGVLNLLGVNCIRTFRDAGTVVFGARTVVSANPAFQPWRYVPVRRMALFIEQTLMNNLGWAVFEPNDAPLWTALRVTVSDFMLSLFNQHAFAGATPSEAFRVVCDATTTTPTDVDNGVANILVAFRPLKPAEFVVIKIAQLAGQAQS
ncbi:MAG TPA: hypothetical protein VHF47_09055 [Acidimicrobiales bacterium]|nr:hypothetical protein [Acidimicrobiales bacterium]